MILDTQDDAIMTGMQSIVMDPGGLMTKVCSELVKTDEQALRLAREDSEATKTSNWVFVEDLSFILLFELFYVIIRT